MTALDVPACWNCGGPAIGEVSTGWPDHHWRWWCRRCLIERDVPAPEDKYGCPRTR